MSSPKSVVDTVVLRYFLLVGRADLLVTLLGAPLGVPRVVYDPDDGNAPLDFKSELRRSVAEQRRRGSDAALERDVRELSRLRADRLEVADKLYLDGQLVVIDHTPDELGLVGQLTSPSGCKAFNLRFPLDPGEAACLAIGVQRSLVVATDDNDALKARESFASPPSYERIRRLLVRAVTEKLITKATANGLHDEMREHGFWDSTPPF